MEVIDGSFLLGKIAREIIYRRTHEFYRRYPSIFNYGTPDAIGNPDYWCHDLDVHPDVIDNGIPIFSEVDVLRVIGTESALNLNFVFQLCDLEFKFNSGTDINLSPEHHSTITALQCEISVKIRVSIDSGTKRDDRTISHRCHAQTFPITNQRIDYFCIELSLSDFVHLNKQRINQIFLNDLEHIKDLQIKTDIREQRLGYDKRLLIDSVIMPWAKDAIKKTACEILGDFRGMRQNSEILFSTTSNNLDFEEDVNNAPLLQAVS